MESNRLNTLRIVALTTLATISFMIFTFFPALRIIVFCIGAAFIGISYLSQKPQHILISLIFYTLIVFIFDGEQIALVQITTLILPSIIL